MAGMDAVKTVLAATEVLRRKIRTCQCSRPIESPIGRDYKVHPQKNLGGFDADFKQKNSRMDPSFFAG